MLTVKVSAYAGCLLDPAMLSFLYRLRWEQSEVVVGLSIKKKKNLQEAHVTSIQVSTAISQSCNTLVRN